MKLKIFETLQHKVGPCILFGWLLKANYALNEEIKDARTFITQGPCVIKVLVSCDKVGPCISIGWLLKAINKRFFTLKVLDESFTPKLCI